MIKIIHVIKKIKKIFFKNTQTKEYLQFIEDGGDRIIFENIKLNINSVIIDGGGFNGEFTDEIIKKKFQKVYIYEPDKIFFEYLKKKYEFKENIEILNYALFNKKQNIILSENSNASSIMENSKVGSMVEAVDILDEFKKYKNIDLLKLNIEGAEYEVISRLLKTQELTKIKYLLVQFHREHDLNGTKFEKIFFEISKNYNVIFNYKYVWSLFIRK
tara:strand:- start:747 stop:1394 length:648 start_codon:yes stop_codon:yes gene_type:complete